MTAYSGTLLRIVLSVAGRSGWTAVGTLESDRHRDEER